MSLLGLGISIALAASCKWVGLFAVVAVGMYTIVDLWIILGDVRVPLKTFGRHFVSRALALIAVPLAIYAATFWIHFALLRDFSPAASSMSIEFQQTLRGGELPSTIANVYFGSQIRIRQYKPDGPFLHSHASVYPEGSKQQQVTGYHHRDVNNLWIIRRAYNVNKTYVVEETDEQQELVQLRHLDEIRLQHVSTGRFLHSHNVDPPVSNKEKQKEVSCYGHDASKFSDYNDNWRIEIVDSKGDSITEDDEDADMNEGEEIKKKPFIFAIGTKFRLTHRLVGCKLHCRNKPLPDWGFKQGEVTCGHETLRSNQIWIVESNEHPLADPNTSMKASFEKKGFLSKFIELNKRMWDSNAGLSAHHPFGSRPDSWLFLTRGIGFWNGNHVPKTEKQHAAEKKAKKAAKNDEADSGEDDVANDADESVDDPEDKQEQARLAQEYVKYKGQQMYLLGNPVVWWSSTAAIGIYVLTLLAYRISKRRNFSFAVGIEKSVFGSQLNFFSFSGFMFIQWLWHYFPFFGMKRQLFLHHYLPALYFAVLLFAILLESAIMSITALARLSDENARRLKIAILSFYVVASIVVFWKLAPLGYGLRMSKTQCESIKWLKRWDFDCGSLVDPVSNAIVTSAA
jgi:dolichyl-phosphate-mannose--protein O-mannosyl transferase